MTRKQQVSAIYQFYKENHLKDGFSYVREAVDLIKKCVQESGFKNFYVSFNGGKDATIVLFLTYFAVLDLQLKVTIPCVYFQEPRPFQETEDFIKQVSEMIDITMIRCETKNYQSELQNLSHNKGLDWIVMGTRKDDPGCSKLGKIAPSDQHKGYPKFNRINPIINWDYDKVWEFILGFQLPYCKLYDQGYTYLGNKDNTVKNQNLYDQAKKQYKKAHQASNEVETLSRKSIKDSNKQKGSIKEKKTEEL